MISACAHVALVNPPRSAGPPAAAATTVIPTRYFADRFFATPVTTAGDTVTLFLDTGGSSLAWEPAAMRLGWHIDSVKQSNGVWRRVAALPEFRSNRTVPPTTAASLQGTRLIIYPLQPATFGDLIARRSQGQLGQLWFDERIWTFDYPHRQLLLHRVAPPENPKAHSAVLEFFTDSTGKRVGHDPRIAVVVDGDTLKLLLDTGATVWLTDAALARVHDGAPAERAISHVRASALNAWHARHPEWLMLPHGDTVTQADIIRVPSVRVAGFDVGPVWFDALPDPTGPAQAPRNRVDGTAGGSLLKFFSATVDYQGGRVSFVKESR